jgi:hypothetical protein
LDSFRKGNKKDEYDRIYNYDIEDSRNYEELDENEDPEEVVERLKGTIGRGDCIYCGGKNTMEYEGHICFICSVCGKAVHEDTYYRWAAGYDIDFED